MLFKRPESRLIRLRALNLVITTLSTLGKVLSEAASASTRRVMEDAMYKEFRIPSGTVVVTIGTAFTPVGTKQSMQTVIQPRINICIIYSKKCQHLYPFERRHHKTPKIQAKDRGKRTYIITLLCVGVMMRGLLLRLRSCRVA